MEVSGRMVLLVLVPMACIADGRMEGYGVDRKEGSAGLKAEASGLPEERHGDLRAETKSVIIPS